MWSMGITSILSTAACLHLFWSQACWYKWDIHFCFTTVVGHLHQHKFVILSMISSWLLNALLYLIFPPSYNRRMVVEGLPKLHNLFAIITQREGVPWLRISIFHLRHKFRSSAFQRVKKFRSWCYTFVSWSTLTTLPGLRACSNSSTLLHRLSFQSISWTCRQAISCIPNKFFLPSILLATSLPPSGLPSYLREPAPPWPDIQSKIKEPQNTEKLI